MVGKHDGKAIRFNTEEEHDKFFAEQEAKESAALARAYNDYAAGKIHGGDMPSTAAVQTQEVSNGEVSFPEYKL